MKTITEQRVKRSKRVRPRQCGRRIMRCNVECPGWDAMVKAISVHDGRASFASLDAYIKSHDARKEADLDKSCTGQYSGRKRLGSDGWPVATSKAGSGYGRAYLSRRPGNFLWFDPQHGYYELNVFSLHQGLLRPEKCPLHAFDIPLRRTLTTGDVSVLPPDSIAEIASYLDAMSLVQLTQTCRLMRAAVKESQPCITKVLSRCTFVAHRSVVRLVPKAPETMWAKLRRVSTKYGYPVQALIHILETTSASWYTQFR